MLKMTAKVDKAIRLYQEWQLAQGKSEEAFTRFAKHYRTLTPAEMREYHKRNRGSGRSLFWDLGWESL